jgi:hypothetical protein
MVNGGWKLLLYDLSPFVNSFENMATFLSLSFLFFSFFFFSLFFPLFFFLDHHVSKIFSVAHVSFVPIDGERDQLISSSFYFVECNGWYNANFS